VGQRGQRAAGPGLPNGPAVAGTIGAVIGEAPGAGGGYRIIVGCGRDTDKLAAGAGRLGGVVTRRGGPLNTWPEQRVREMPMVRTVVRMAQPGTDEVVKARRVMGRPGL